MAFSRSADFQSAVSKCFQPAWYTSAERIEISTVCRLEIGDTADRKSALQQKRPRHSFACRHVVDGDPHKFKERAQPGYRKPLVVAVETVALLLGHHAADAVGLHAFGTQLH